MERRTGFRKGSIAALSERWNRAGELYNEFVYDEHTDTSIIRTTQDVEPILERNVELQNEGVHGDGYTPSRDLRWVASIPLVFVHKWLAEEGLNVFDPDHWEALKRKLNDPEFSKLRTHLGSI